MGVYRPWHWRRGWVGRRRWCLAFGYRAGGGVGCGRTPLLSSTTQGPFGRCIMVALWAPFGETENRRGGMYGGGQRIFGLYTYSLTRTHVEHTA